MTPDSTIGIAPRVTTRRTLQQGKPSGYGTEAAYYRLVDGPGELRARRLDLAPDAAHGAAPPTTRRSLLHFAYVTDMHVLDAESPGRYEFVERMHGPAELHLLLPAYRPQETIHLQACEVMLQSIGAIEASHETGAPLQLVFCGGDNTDSVQLNELRAFMAFLRGGTVRPGSGGTTYEGVESPEWPDPGYWRPDQCEDDYKRRWGFPAHPGLLEEASRPFPATGLRLPWLSCFGNHDAFVLGAARPNDAYTAVVTGSTKTVTLPEEFDPLDHLDLFIPHPEAFLHGSMRTITSDSARRPYTRREFVAAHLEPGGNPAGHGFTARNLADNTTHYTHDATPQLRLLVLDTVNPGGNFPGSIGAAQLAWLEERLVEVHSRYYDVSGRLVETRNADRLVVICSHHGLTALVNDLVAPEVEADLPRALGPKLEALLHRFPNVILWLNGHTHRNRATPHPDPSGRTSGFWEVTTCSLLDWPAQARLVEIVSNHDGTLSVLCTMVDHGGPADPREAQGLARLASLHRELAANDPHAGITGPERGRPHDRNVDLVLPAPFPLD